jgi:hypothetical protein
VSLLASNDNSRAFCYAGGSTSMLVLSLMWWSSSCTPNVWDKLLKSLSQFSKRAKLPLRQWSSVCRYLQLEVSVMRYRHESGKRRSPKNGVGLRGPINNLKFDLLLPEVCRGTENDV